MELNTITSLFSGTFLQSPEILRQRLAECKAYIFDWDGVFNDGFKDAQGSSPYSEIDAMGTNLLRFSHFLSTGDNPLVAVITGEHNQAAFTLAKREHFQAVYFRIRHKSAAIEHLCEQFGLWPEQIAFVYDDVLDLSAAQISGLRIMVPYTSKTLFRLLVEEHAYADYLTGADGRQHAVRETTELLMALRGNYKEAVQHRAAFDATYQAYLARRQREETRFFTVDDSDSIQPSFP
jgi:3-deoxy-D-manno-octulosonate 8-phosphate phosphatase (KDO 8-P phosphatase)